MRAVLAAMVLPLACSSTEQAKPDSGGLNADATVPDKAEGDAGREVAVNECDPVLQDCPGAEVCAPRCRSAEERFACAAEMRGAGAQGQTCASNSDCKKGTTCIAPTGRPQLCYTWCDPAGPACPAGTMCVETTMHLACGGVQTLKAHLCYPPPP